MHTTTPEFVHVCRLLVRHMEESPGQRDAVLQAMQRDLLQQGMVFDLALAGELYDRLAEEPGLGEEGHLDQLRQKVQRGSYFNENMLDTLGDRILRSLQDLL